MGGFWEVGTKWKGSNSMVNGLKIHSEGVPDCKSGTSGMLARSKVQEFYGKFSAYIFFTYFYNSKNQHFF